jgi:hypothetical protein
MSSCDLLPRKSQQRPIAKSRALRGTVPHADFRESSPSFLILSTSHLRSDKHAVSLRLINSQSPAYLIKSNEFQEISNYHYYGIRINFLIYHIYNRCYPIFDLYFTKMHMLLFLYYNTLRKYDQPLPLSNM